MKARVKATGEIVEVEEYHKYLETGWKYRDNAGTLYKPSALYFGDEAVIDYWTRLEHQYAGMAMQGLLANPAFWKMDWCNKDTSYVDLITMRAHSHAHALVENMKEKEK